jgi:hypothetical protein
MNLIISEGSAKLVAFQGKGDLNVGTPFFMYKKTRAIPCFFCFKLSCYISGFSFQYLSFNVPSGTFFCLVFHYFWSSR